MYIKENVSKYTEYKDDDIIVMIHNGDEIAQEYILNKYKGLVKIKSRTYFIIGADKEDIIQEGMIGLYKAIRDYKNDKSSNFYSFAELCITRQIITAIKAATRQKHIPLNSSLSLNKSVYDENTEYTYIELLSSNKLLNPEEFLIGQEDKNYIENHIIAVLSELECRVLSLYLQGNSYNEIAKIIKKDEKSIDNALQRVKKKVEKILKEKNLTTPQKYAKI